MGLASVSFLDFDGKWEKRPAGCVRCRWAGHSCRIEREGVGNFMSGLCPLAFYHEDGRGCLFHMDKFLDKEPIEGIVKLTDEPAESMVIATPFDKPGHLLQPEDQLHARRGLDRAGSRRYELTKDKFFRCARLGPRRVTYHNTWYWGSASGELDGAPFG